MATSQQPIVWVSYLLLGFDRVVFVSHLTPQFLRDLHSKRKIVQTYNLQLFPTVGKGILVRLPLACLAQLTLLLIYDSDDWLTGS